MEKVTVVGAGVIGRTCAFALREAGFDVRVIAREEPTVSEVAGGLWMPFSVPGDRRVLIWARGTMHWLEERGHPVVAYRHIESVKPAWLSMMPSHRVTEVDASEWICSVPLVEMPRHLAELWDGPIEIADLTELPSGLVVNCTGLGARALCGDTSVRPARGQVVHVRAPVGVPCVCDEDELTYVLPRGDVCVVGGFYQLDDWSAEVREHETADILERAARLVPALRDAEVLGARAGLRPVRDGGPRVEREGDVIHCYGHGGAGVTLSWGCAQEVVRLARGA